MPSLICSMKNPRKYQSDKPILTILSEEAWLEKIQTHVFASECYKNNKSIGEILTVTKPSE